MLNSLILGILLCVAGSFALYDSSSDVVELTPSNFDRLVTSSNEVWIVEFYAPWCGHCKNLVPEYKKAARALKGIIKVGAVDADEHKSLAQNYGVTGFPTLKIFTGSKHTPYQGQRTAEAFVDAGLKAAKEKAYENLGKKSGGSSSSDKSDVITLTDSNFKELVLDSEDLWLVEFYAPWCGHCKNLEPHWAKAATELKGKAVDEATMKACSEKPLCVVSVLPHILDCNAACRNDYLAVLARLADKYKSKMWGWVWAEAGAQPALEEALELGGFGYPAMAVVNAKKLKFSTLRGSFSETGINEFLRDLSFGRGQTAPVRGAEMPKITTTEPWDGKDGELPPEEDIDLSDVDLEKDEL